MTNLEKYDTLRLIISLSEKNITCDYGKRYGGVCKNRITYYAHDRIFLCDYHYELTKKGGNCDDEDEYDKMYQGKKFKHYVFVKISEYPSYCQKCKNFVKKDMHYCNHCKREDDYNDQKKRKLSELNVSEQLDFNGEIKKDLLYCFEKLVELTEENNTNLEHLSNLSDLSDLSTLDSIDGKLERLNKTIKKGFTKLDKTLNELVDVIRLK